MTVRAKLVATSVLVLTCFIADLRFQPGGPHITRIVDDCAQLAGAAVADAAALWRAARLRARMKASWTLIGLGAMSWTLGELIWCYFELVAGTTTPFPSLADVGFLGLPVAVGVGIAVRPSRAFAGRSPIRILVDVLLVLVSLFVLSWATALGQVYRGGAATVLGRVVALAYPACDVALLAVVVIVLSYSSLGRRAGLSWLGTGLVAFAIADSSFAYLTAIGHYRTGNLIDAGWLAGFLTLACSAVLDDNTPKRTDRPAAVIPRTALLLPYVPAPIGLLIAGWRLEVEPTDRLVLPLAATIVLLLVARQILILLDNQSLLASITHQALHDSLTGLANRALFTDRLERAVEQHSQDRHSVAILIIDLDDFKTVNDCLGHPAGDELLIHIGNRLRDSVRQGDTVARLGGDEFAVLIEDGGDPVAIAARITTGLQDPIPIGNRDIPVRCSIGLAAATTTDPATSATDLLRHADLAMYHAKRDGKGRLTTFTSDMVEIDGAELDLRGALAVDLAAGRIQVAYQPIQRADGSGYGAEALARWSYLGEPVSPATFLPIAAKLGMATRLDQLVLRTAIAHASTWPADQILSVNLSGQTLADPSLRGSVTAALAASGFSAGRLTVEVLESSLIEDDHHAVSMLHQLRLLGVRIAVDDFGAGFASIARLHALQPDVIKIDRTLIWAHNPTQARSSLLDGAAELAHRFGAIVIAEGIETASQRAAAVSAGCDALQGYLIGRPVIPIVRHARQLTVA